MSSSGSGLISNPICPVCGTAGHTVIRLENYPLTEVYQPHGQNTFSFPAYYPQGLNFCPSCSHGYLNTLLPRNFIYENYNTHSAVSVGSVVAINNFHDFVTANLKGKHKVILDIGANDTTLLKKFKDSGARLIGVDPNVSSDDPQIETIRGYVEDVDMAAFGTDSKLYLCSHTLEHIFNPAEFLAQLQSVAQPDDEFFFQFPSLDLLVRDARFDQVHHQHIHYFSLYSFSKLLDKSGFELVTHAFDADHYGTLMSCFRKKRSASTIAPVGNTHTVSQILLAYRAFTTSFASANQRLEIDPQGFACYGASLMLPILHYYMPNLIQASTILDTNPSKFGLSYVNFDVKITDAAAFDYKNANVVVTAISTKLATRKIVSNLVAAGALNIILPYNTL